VQEGSKSKYVDGCKSGISVGCEPRGVCGPYRIDMLRHYIFFNFVGNPEEVPEKEVDIFAVP